MISAEEQVRAAIASQAAEWFVEHRAGELSEARHEAFTEWLRASPAHVREYLALTGFADDLRQVSQRFAAPVDALVARARRGDGGITSLFPAVPARGASRPRWMAAAAVLSMIAVATFVAVWWNGSRTEYATAHAEQRSWRLPDGSTVHMNSDSEIRVRFDADRREVRLLKGQAIFNVAKDAVRPFWVDAGDVAVRAVGTEFDVYRQSQQAVVSVMEGRVVVWSTAETTGAPAAQLDAGQQVRVSNQTVVVSKQANAVRKTVAWLQRQVVFDHDPLGSAVQEFNRYNELQIRVADAALQETEVSGIFSAYDTDSFVDFLERQAGMRVERSGGAVTVYAR